MLRHKPYLLIMQTWYKVTKKILLVSIVILFILMLVLLGMITFDQNKTWISTLTIPNIAPPSWLLVSIWTVLYTLIVISIIMVLGTPKKEARNKSISIGLFILNGILTALLTLLFFGMKSVLLAFIEMPLLLGSTLLLIWCISRYNKIAAYLLIPYFLWTCYGSVLLGIILFIN